MKPSQIIYEVNLIVDEDIYSKYFTWLQEHVSQMLKFKGFINAHIFEIKDDKKEGKKLITVQYVVNSMEDLNDYFKNHSTKMREDGLNRFPNKFTANRRILECLQ